MNFGMPNRERSRPFGLNRSERGRTYIPTCETMSLHSAAEITTPVHNVVYHETFPTSSFEHLVVLGQKAAVEAAITGTRTQCYTARGITERRHCARLGPNRLGLLLEQAYRWC